MNNASHVDDAPASASAEGAACGYCCRCAPCECEECSCCQCTGCACPT
jgi:hypothetical protein